jgi:hypothetical protein
MSPRRTRQFSRLILVSAFSLALGLPAAAQPGDRLEVGSLWQTLLSWLRPLEATPTSDQVVEVEILPAGVSRDPNGTPGATDSPPEPQDLGTSSPSGSGP